VLMTTPTKRFIMKSEPTIMKEMKKNTQPT
jgi:hypothetical protein